jgi:transposase InsO family protein
VLAEYVRHYNSHRPHQALQQESLLGQLGCVVDVTARIERRKVLGGLISEYHRAALASEKLLVSGHRRVLARHRQYQQHYSTARPHQGINQLVPSGENRPPRVTAGGFRTRQILRKSILSGLINEYARTIFSSE